MRAGVACLLLGITAMMLACGGQGEAGAPSDSPTSAATEAPSPSASPPPLTPQPSPTEGAAATDWAGMIAGVAEYLTANGGSADCLAGLFAEWNMPSDGTPSCVAADLDGDGDDGYVVRLTRLPGPTDSRGYSGTWLAGEILIFDHDPGAYSPVFNLADLLYPCPYPPCGEPVLSNPVIYSVQDLNDDAIPELVFTSGHCGAHTCFINLHIFTKRDGAYVSLLTPQQGSGGFVSVPLADDQLRVEDIDGDGISEIVLRQGMVASAGAGPQREAVLVYSWDGEKFVLTHTTYDQSNAELYALYFLIRDADDAFIRASYSDASALYREALEQPDLPDNYFGAGDSAELRAYARFRIGLSFAGTGDPPSALMALDDTVAADPQALHSRLAERFRDAYAPASDMAAGCSAALAFVDENADAFRQVWEYGYANPNVGVERTPLCPF